MKITQTTSVETTEENCQTDQVMCLSKEVQAYVPYTGTSVEIEAQADLLEELKKEIEEKVKDELNKKAQKKRLSIKVPMDSSGGPQEE